jgi:hypothetical protein
MQQAVTEAAIGTVNSINVQFQTTASYLPGTVLVYLNGQLRKQEMVTETGNRTFTLDSPPHTGDSVEVRYISVV